MSKAMQGLRDVGSALRRIMDPTIRMPYWWAPKPGFRRSFAEILRYVADRIGPADAFTGTGMSIYLVNGRGWALDRDGKKGVRVYNRRNEYDGRQWNHAEEVPVGDAVDILFGPDRQAAMKYVLEDEDNPLVW